MPVLVTKDSRIATEIVLDVIPLTVSEAISGIPSNHLPENIPTDNPFSPPFAGNNIYITTLTVKQHFNFVSVFRFGRL